MAKPTGCTSPPTGLGVLHPRPNLGAERVQAGDRVLLSGPIGNHGMAIMLARAELEIEADIQSDTRRSLSWPRALLDNVGEATCIGCATRRAAAWPRCSTNWPATPMSG